MIDPRQWPSQPDALDSEPLCLSLIDDKDCYEIGSNSRFNTIDSETLEAEYRYEIGWNFQFYTMDPEPLDDAYFPSFPRLPAEIRCFIWELLTTQPRVVPIMYDIITTSYRPRIRPPPVLQTNRESRLETLRVYKELKLGQYPNVGCYINLNIDSVYLRSTLDRINNRIGDDSSIEPWQRGRLITTSPAAANVAASDDASGASSQNTQPDPANTSDPSDIEARNSTAPNPDMLRSRRHSKIILDDLIHSPHREHIFRDFHINYATWDLMRRYYRHRRHKITCHIKQLSIVFERGHEPLKSDFNMQPLGQQELIAEGDPARSNDYEEKRNAHRLVSGLKSSNSFVNWRDKKAGRPVVLNYPICAKSLDKGNLDIPEIPEDTASEMVWTAALGLQFPQPEL